MKLISKISFYLILIGVFSLGFSKSIWLFYPDFYAGKFSYLSTGSITISGLLIFTGSLLGILSNKNKISLNPVLTILGILLILKSITIHSPLIFAQITLLSLIIYSSSFDKEKLKLLLKYFTYGIIIQCTLAIFQFIFQTSTNIPLLHFLGEPELNETTKGLSKITILSETFFRSYGTTNHPNFLATLILTGLSFQPNNIPKTLQTLKIIGLLTTFSLSNLTGFTINQIKKQTHKLKYLLIVIPLVFLAIKLNDLNYAGFNDRLFQFKQFFQQDFSIFNIIVGKQDELNQLSNIKLQPWEQHSVHNHFLLTFQTYGLLGLTFLILILKKIIQKNYILGLTFLPILLLDNLFITLPNGLLLAGLIFIFLKESLITSNKITN